jgi:hypothetical protein
MMGLAESVFRFASRLRGTLDKAIPSAAVRTFAHPLGRKTPTVVTAKDSFGFNHKYNNFFILTIFFRL